MKSDNEPTISLTVYFKSVKKNENMFAKITENKNKRTPQKSFYRRESNAGLPTWKVYALSITQRIISNTLVKLIIFNTFAHEILPVDDV